MDTVVIPIPHIPQSAVAYRHARRGIKLAGIDVGIHRSADDKRPN
jgi:hypothetical protein